MLDMGLAAKRIASFMLAAGGWFLAAIRTTLDLIGWSTAPDDVGVAMTRVDQILSYIVSLPWWVPWGFALASTMWLMWVSWPRERRMDASPDTPQIPELAQSGGDTFAAIGSVSRLHLYVGRIQVWLPGLEVPPSITLHIHCYNGSDTAVTVTGVDGAAEVEGFGSLRAHIKGITGVAEPYSSFSVRLGLQVSTDLANYMLRLPTKKAVYIKMFKVNVNVIGISADRNVTRLPIWDEIAIRRDPDELHANRVIGLRGITTQSRIS